MPRRSRRKSPAKYGRKLNGSPKHRPGPKRSRRRSSRKSPRRSRRR